MGKTLVRIGVLLSIWGICLPTSAVELRFQTNNSANLFWMVDQMSMWDAQNTNPEYRAYWEKKLGLTDEDLTILGRYARLRRNHARFKESEVLKETSPWVSLFGRNKLLPHETFALAFLETNTPLDAVGFLRLSPQDSQIVVDALKHFARKFKDVWGDETAHLKTFAQKAEILISLADASGFIDKMRTFLGVSGPLPEVMPVDILWAPPGVHLSAHMDFHILLPVAVQDVETDEQVLQQLSLVMQEAGDYLLSKLPAQTLGRASRHLLESCGYINSAKPDVVKEALLVALGEVLFLQDRFPDLPAKALLVPYDNRLEYPFAADELAREFVLPLRQTFNTPGGFFPTFLDQAVEIHKDLFPPRPRFFASTGMLYGSSAARELFNALFTPVDQTQFDVEQEKAFLKAQDSEPGRTTFILATAREEGSMWKALREMAAAKALGNEFPKLKRSNFIFPIARPGAGAILVVWGTDLDGVRKALLNLYTMQSMPRTPVVVE